MPVGKSVSGAVRILPWDTNFWGFRVAGWAASKLTAPQLRRGFRWCRRNRIRCLYFCADGEDFSTQRLLQKEGFVFIDVRTEMKKKLLLPLAASSRILLRRAACKELPLLRRVASQAHDNTRFAKDPGFPPAAVRRLYSLWLAKAARKGGVQVPAGGSGRPVGYIVCEMEGKRSVKVGLIAVLPHARGRGLGRKLLLGAEHWSRHRGAREMRAVTQGLSVKALRMYEGVGFRASRVQVWFHRWFAE